MDSCMARETMLKYQFVLALLLLKVCHCSSTQCYTPTNTTIFEEQLGHLMEQSSDIEVHNISYLYSMDDAMCDRSPNASPTFLSERSVCPWEIEWDIREHRYPPVLAFARCRCSRCLNNFECRPVYYRIPVLEKECLGNTLQYVKAYVAVPVGCVCVQPRIRRMKKSFIMKMLKSKFALTHRNDRFVRESFPTLKDYK